MGTVMNINITHQYVKLSVLEKGDHDLVLRNNQTSAVEEPLEPGEDINRKTAPIVQAPITDAVSCCLAIFHNYKFLIKNKSLINNPILE